MNGSFSFSPLKMATTDPLFLWVVATPLFSGLYYFLISGVYLLLDLTHKPSVLYQGKIQKNKNDRLTWENISSAYVTLVLNLLVINPILMVLFWPFAQLRGNSISFNHEISIFKLVLEIAFFTVLEEVMFYYSHRLLHTPKWYGKIHKKHHEWPAPIGLVAAYAHPGILHLCVLFSDWFC
jgi:sterol desaturase/sphingolipid hydroxylase (fatty acid hydroxylase superfamily)